MNENVVGSAGLVADPDPKFPKIFDVPPPKTLVFVVLEPKGEDIPWNPCVPPPEPANTDLAAGSFD
jgi:hypothetical protein